MQRNTVEENVGTGGEVGANSPVSNRPRALDVIERGMQDFDSINELGWQTAGDVLSGRVTYEVGNTVAKHMINVIKATSVQLRHGTSDPQAWKNRKRVILSAVKQKPI